MSASSFTLSSLFASSSSFVRRPGPLSTYSTYPTCCPKRNNDEIIRINFSEKSYGWSSVVEFSGKFETSHHLVSNGQGGFIYSEA